MSTPERLLDALGPALLDRAGDLLPELVAALAGPLDDTTTLVEPGPNGWAAVYDLDQTPQPAVLGQLAGTTVPLGLTVEQQRDWIREHPGWLRGTPAQLLSVLLPLLTGYQRVDIYERDTSPWHITVRVYSQQLAPGVTDATIKAAALAHKPVGVVMLAEAAAGGSFAHHTAEHGATLADWAAEFPTFEAARTHLPEEGSAS